MTITRFRLILLPLTVLLALGSCSGDNLRRVALPDLYRDQNTAGTPRIQKSGKAIAPLENPWKSFEEDLIHDPESPAFNLLQRPSEALRELPRDVAGNYVNWGEALEQGYINPRTNLYEETDVNVIDLDIFFDLNGSLPIVRFPHRPHTLWLDCKNCHNEIFIPKAGGNDFTMVDILNGKYCGQCHGAVAFPLTECERCHSVSREEYRQISASTKKSGNRE